MKTRLKKPPNIAPGGYALKNQNENNLSFSQLRENLRLLPTTCFIAFRESKTENLFPATLPRRLTGRAIALIGFVAALRRVLPSSLVALWSIEDLNPCQSSFGRLFHR